MQVLLQQSDPSLSCSLQSCEICCNPLSHPVSLFQQSLICYHCWHQHISATILRISYKAGSQIMSPFEGTPPIDICIALNSLDKNHAQEVEEWLFKKYSSFTPDIEKCPSETCDYIFMMEKCKWKEQDQKCPKCEAVLQQSINLNIKELVGFIYFLFLTNKCPKCEIPIEKTTGCPHMTCPCGHQFCWFCLKDYFSTANNVYSVHEPKECAFVFISKILFMSICLLGIILTFLGNDIFHQFVSYFFIGLKYILMTIFLDLIIISNVLVVNQIIQKVRYYHHYGHSNRPSNVKYFIGGLVFVDALLLVGFYFLEIYSLIFWILVIEVSVCALGALMVWLVVHSIETWFDYIC